MRIRPKVPSARDNVEPREGPLRSTSALRNQETSARWRGCRASGHDYSRVVCRGKPTGRNAGFLYLLRFSVQRQQRSCGREKVARCFPTALLIEPNPRLELFRKYCGRESR
jgi:hypothetical protein